MNGMGLMPQALFTGHMGQSQRTVQTRMWQQLAGQALSPDGVARGNLLYDDFQTFYPVTVTTAAGQLQPGNGYFAYIEADATVGSIKPVADKMGGVIKLLTSTDSADGDNHDTVLGTNGNVGVLGKISDTAGSDKALVADFRFQLASVTDGDGSVFLGLGEKGLCAANTPIQDDSGHTLSDDDVIGFFIGEDDNDALKFVYRKNGGALQTVLTYGTALAKDTWYQAGFIYNPAAPPAKRIKIFVDNVEQSTYVTATNIAAATFPDGEDLAMYAAIKGSDDNDAQSFLLDSWAFFQAH